jgi:hypothetical protein
MVKKKSKPRRKLTRVNHRINQSQNVNVKVLIPHAPKPIRRRRVLKNPRSTINGGRSVQFIPPPLIQYDNSRIGSRENPIDLVKKEFDKIEKSLDAKISPLQQRFNTPPSKLEDDLGFQQAKKSVLNTQKKFREAEDLGKVLSVGSTINSPIPQQPNFTTSNLEEKSSVSPSQELALNMLEENREEQRQNLQKTQQPTRKKPPQLNQVITRQTYLKPQDRLNRGQRLNR